MHLGAKLKQMLCNPREVKNACLLQGKVHRDYPITRLMHWRTSGPFTDDMLLQHQGAGCWLQLWLARLVHELAVPPRGELARHHIVPCNLLDAQLPGYIQLPSYIRL